MARHLYAVAPDGYVVKTQTQNPYTHMVIAPEHDGSGKWHRVSAHGSEARARKALDGVRANGHGNCIIVPVTEDKPTPVKPHEPGETTEAKTILGYPVHPDADLFPLIEGDEFEALKADILLHGLREPIVLLDGAILDGRNRARALEDIGLSPTTVEADLSGKTPAEFVASLNLHRRHLTGAQRKRLAADLYERIVAEQASLPKAERKNAKKEAAKQAGVSERTVMNEVEDRKVASGEKPAPAPKATGPRQSTEPAGVTVTADLLTAAHALTLPSTTLTKSEHAKALAAAREVVSRLEGWQFA